MNDRSLSSRISDIVLGFEATEHQDAIRALAIDVRALEKQSERAVDCCDKLTDVQGALKARVKELEDEIRETQDMLIASQMVILQYETNPQPRAGALSGRK